MKPTSQELAVLDLLLTGADNKEIAKELHIATRTVKQHLHRLFLKYQIEDGIKRVKLAVKVYKERNPA